MNKLAYQTAQLTLLYLSAPILLKSNFRIRISDLAITFLAMSITSEQLGALFRAAYETNVTDPYHRNSYPAIAPSNPKLSQAGRTVLIPGGGTNVGFGISKAFVQAKADTLIIVARRLEVLEEAAAKLRKEAETAGSHTKIIVRQLDVADLTAVQKFWEDLAAESITVDVFVNNAVRFSEPKPLLALGFEELQAQFDVNVKSAIYLTEQFVKQPGEKQRVCSYYPFHATGLAC